MKEIEKEELKEIARNLLKGDAYVTIGDYSLQINKVNRTKTNKIECKVYRFTENSDGDEYKTHGLDREHLNDILDLCRQIASVRLFDYSIVCHAKHYGMAECYEVFIKMDIGAERQESDEIDMFESNIKEAATA